jgi:hypothetical protein
VTLGFLEGAVDSKPAISTLGSQGVEVEAKPAISTTAFAAGRKSDSSSYCAEIEAGLTSGLSLKRIHQDLVSDHAFTGSYQSVKRFAHTFAASIDPPFRRIECAPGEEMQVDFGSAAWVVEAARRRRPHLFRCVLSMLDHQESILGVRTGISFGNSPREMHPRGRNGLFRVRPGVGSSR